MFSEPFQNFSLKFIATVFNDNICTEQDFRCKVLCLNSAIISWTHNGVNTCIHHSP